MVYFSLNIFFTEGKVQIEVSRDGDDDEVPKISKWEAFIWLAILTAWISLLSDYLVDAIQVCTFFFLIQLSLQN